MQYGVLHALWRGDSGDKEAHRLGRGTRGSAMLMENSPRNELTKAFQNMPSQHWITHDTYNWACSDCAHYSRVSPEMSTKNTPPLDQPKQPDGLPFWN